MTGLELQVEQPHIFHVKGSIQITVPVLLWITENTTSYRLNDLGVSLMGCRRGHPFEFSVAFDTDVDAVRFKMTWFGK